MIFWVLLGESLVIFLPERIYMMHLRDAALADERRGKAHHSELTKDGIARKRMQDQIDELKAQFSKRRPFDEHERLIQAGSAADRDQEPYWRDAIKNMLAQRERMPKASLGYLAKTFASGRTAAELATHLQYAVDQGWCSREDFDRIMQTPATATPNGVEPDGPPPDGDLNDDQSQPQA